SYETNRFTNAAYSAPPVLNGPELAMIVYTSGTSGKPKAVMLSQRNLSSAAHYGSSIIDVNVGDHLLVLLPNHHMYTIGHCFLSAMFVGGALCLNDSIYNTFSNIKKFNIDIIVVVPAVMRLFKNEIQSQLRRAGFGPLDSLNKVKRALVTTLIRKRIGPNLKQIVCGGAPLDPSYVAFFKLLDIELLAGYGMTECAPLISCQVYRHVDFQRPDSVGRPGVCCEAKIVDREIWVSGEHVMLGYYKDPDETAKALTDEGWLKTGDIGHLDEEGFLYITGRLKNLIILGNGENVSPEELEAMFDDSQNIDGIIVSANNDLDIISAEIHPAKTVVDSMGLEQAQTLIRQEVKEQNKNLPLYKQIQIINFREQPFEKTSSLKIKR
ncbi:MAG: AMP-binding protein, partial [Peptococcaceae bacterium]|nr:AMP-binding protein [Peptococcaceae bacterium]